MNPLSARVTLVTGKGGVGKTTVAVLLALLSAARGRRTLLVETSGAASIPPLFGKAPGGYRPQELRPRLWTMSVTAGEAIEDYVVQQIKVRKLYELVFKNRVMGPFLDAVPGLPDLIQLGKVFDLNREEEHGQPVWDALVVDAPATGHGVTMLNAPSAMMEMTRKGAFFDGARQVHDVVDDPDRAAVVLVSLPEEMPVNETLDLWSRLGSSRERVAMCVLNEQHPPPPTDPEDWAKARPALIGAPDPGVREAAHLMDLWLRRVDRQDEARRRLREGLPVPVLDLPFLFRRDLGPADLDRLAAALGQGLQGVR